jgi:hypothetical protein
MGMFSFITQNSGKSIIIYDFQTKKYPCKTYYMWDNNGNVWIEEMYRGYGMFGGKDYYILLAEMNCEYDDDVSDEEKRCDGIDMEGNKEFLHPNLTDCLSWTWRNKCPSSCMHQGGLIAFE